ncbi:MAG TPA: hypothetical protein PLH72_06205 [Vicinamibacterales bacterium]|nr:hypothetical protein [Acidobacteriota bacterium]HQZ38614.1 hypothetical protein [Vicinamibacterales bacterium]
MSAAGQNTPARVPSLEVESGAKTRDLETFVRLQHEIPVLEIDGHEVARHRITPPVLVAALEDAGIR